MAYVTAILARGSFPGDSLDDGSIVDGLKPGAMSIVRDLGAIDGISIGDLGPREFYGWEAPVDLRGRKWWLFVQTHPDGAEAGLHKLGWTLFGRDVVRAQEHELAEALLAAARRTWPNADCLPFEGDDCE